MEQRQISEAGRPLNESSAGAGWVNVLLAIWVIISPFVLGFAQFHRATWNNVATGCAIAIVAIIRTNLRNQPAWSWANIILGIWLIASPFALAFVTFTNAIWSNVIVGIVIAAVACSNSVRTVSAVTIAR